MSRWANDIEFKVKVSKWQRNKEGNVKVSKWHRSLCQGEQMTLRWRGLSQCQQMAQKWRSRWANNTQALPTSQARTGCRSEKGIPAQFERCCATVCWFPWLVPVKTVVGFPNCSNSPPSYHRNKGRTKFNIHQQVLIATWTKSRKEDRPISRYGGYLDIGPSSVLLPHYTLSLKKSYKKTFSEDKR